MPLRKAKCAAHCNAWAWIRVPHPGPRTRLFCVHHEPRGYRVYQVACEVCGMAAYSTNGHVSILCPRHGPRPDPCCIQ